MTNLLPLRRPCPDLLPWCTDHFANPDGYHSHRTGEVAADGFSLGGNRIVEVIVQGERLDDTDGSRSAVVWLHYGEEPIELQPAAARILGRAMAAVADALAPNVAAEAVAS